VTELSDFYDQRQRCNKSKKFLFWAAYSKYSDCDLGAILTHFMAKMDSQTPRANFRGKLNVHKKFQLKIPTLIDLIAVPSDGQTKFEKNSLAENLGMFIDTKNMFVFCGQFLTVFDWFKPTVYRSKSS
jgi:hypothetical protein